MRKSVKIGRFNPWWGGTRHGPVHNEDEITRMAIRSSQTRRGVKVKPTLPKLKFMERDEEK